MQRRTITIPDDLGARIDALVEHGQISSVSRFFQDAARSHLADLDGENQPRDLGTTRSAATLHRAPAEPPAARPPWGRLG